MASFSFLFGFFSFFFFFFFFICCSWKVYVLLSRDRRLSISSHSYSTPLSVPSSLSRIFRRRTCRGCLIIVRPRSPQSSVPRKNLDHLSKERCLPKLRSRLCAKLACTAGLEIRKLHVSVHACHLRSRSFCFGQNEQCLRHVYVGLLLGMPGDRGVITKNSNVVAVMSFVRFAKEIRCTPGAGLRIPGALGWGFRSQQFLIAKPSLLGGTRSNVLWADN